MPYSTTQRPFHLTTPLADDVLLLHRFHGEEALSRPFEFRLDMLSEDSALDPKALVGQRITLHANDSDGEADGKCWSGIVASFGRTGSHWCAAAGEREEMTTYEAVIVPWFWKLKLVEDCRIFQNMSIPDIVDAMLTELQLGTHESDLSSTYAPLEYCVQYGESSFDFISRLLEDAGIHYYFRHDPDALEDVLVISDHQEKDYGDQVRSLRFAANWAEQDEAVVFALARRQHMRTARVMMRDFDFVRPTQDLETSVDTMLAVGASDSLQSFRYPGGYLERDAGDERVRLAMEIEEAAHELLDGTSTLMAIQPGVAFQLDDAPNEVLDPTWRTVRVSHVGENNFDDDSGESYYRNDFTVMPLALPFRPQRVTRKPRMHGPQTAIITGPVGEEIHTDEYGRVKVHFFWDHLGTSDERSSCFIRVSQTWSGRRWGAFFLPRIGMEVIVDFIDGDPDHPLVTGCVYNGDNPVPYALPSHATVSTLKSNSSKGANGFNELRFEDRKNSEQLFLHAQQRMDHVVRSSLYERVGGSREIRVGYKDKGDLNTLVHRDINQHLQGGQYELVDKKLNANVKDEVVQIYEKSQTTVITERMTLNAKEIVHEGEELISHKAGRIAIQGAQNVSVKSGVVCIEGTTSVNLKCGSSFIVLTPSGIFINGSTVMINSGGAAQAAQAPATAMDPEIETPFDADAATSALPGESTGGGGGGAGAGGAGRTRQSRKVPLRRAKDPPPPPPDGSHIVPGGGLRKLLTVVWVEAETWCSEPATLSGTSEGYSDGETEPAQVRHVVDGSIQTGLNVTITGNSFNQPVEVKNWLPRQSGGHYETERMEDGFVAGLKTPVPLRMRFIPTLTRTDSSIGRSTFALAVTDYMATIEGGIIYVKGWIQFLIQLGATVPAGTGGNAGVNFGSTAGTFSGTDWRFGKENTGAGGGKSYWDGSAWQPVPATWADPTATLLYPIGIWREGATNRAQFGNNWPEAIPVWGATQNASAAATLPTWTANINAAWTNKFDLKRKECLSTEPACCRYKTRCNVSFTEVATRTGHAIVLAANTARSNAGAWSLGEARAGMPPHEFGHLLGNPDEYAGGVGVDASVNTDGATAGIDANSMMGSNMTTVKKRHYNTICLHLAAMVSTQCSKTYTYEAVAVV